MYICIAYGCCINIKKTLKTLKWDGKSLRRVNTVECTVHVPLFFLTSSNCFITLGRAGCACLLYGFSRSINISRALSPSISGLLNEDWNLGVFSSSSRRSRRSAPPPPPRPSPTHKTTDEKFAKYLQIKILNHSREENIISSDLFLTLISITWVIDIKY